MELNIYKYKDCQLEKLIFSLFQNISQNMQQIIFKESYVVGSLSTEYWIKKLKSPTK